MLTKEGLMNQFGAFCMGDFTYTVGQRETLDAESIKGLLQTEEQCEHKARYYNGRWPAERVRMFSMNAGMNEDGTTDYGSTLLLQGLVGPAMMARDRLQDLLAADDHVRAMARRVLVCRMPDAPIHKGAVDSKAEERAKERRARQLAYEQSVK
jgi:hypothetical protein